MSETPSTSNPLAPTSLYPRLTSENEQVSKNDNLHRKSQKDTTTLDESLDIILRQFRQMFVISREIDRGAQNTTEYKAKLNQFDDAIRAAKSGKLLDVLQQRTPAHATLLNDLEEQLNKAKTLSKTFKALNDLDRASTMDKWASNTYRDINTLITLTSQGRAIPDVIWETRRVKSFKLFMHIEPNQCEIKIENLLEMPKELHNKSIFIKGTVRYSIKTC